MTLFLITLLAFGLALFGMSLGVIFSDRRIRGSCGGLSHLGGKRGTVGCDGCPSGGKNCSNDGRVPAMND
ncbi:MAG: (Na+)-NQR maturation NqrM [Pirellulales bacterium]